MSDSDLQAELAQMRDEIATLKKASTTAQETNTQQEKTSPPENNESLQANEQLKEVFALLETEAKDHPLLAGATLFALGVLVGKAFR